MSKVYKVVSIDNGKMVSVTKGNEVFIDLGLIVTYKKDMETKPNVKCSKLFAFRTLRDAKSFAPGIDDLDVEIWECDAELALQSRDSLIGWTYGLDLKSFKAFWKDRRNGFAADCLRGIPMGTVLCNSITPRKRIWKSSK